MPTILISPESIEGDYFAVEGEEAHHLLRVLRKKPGDEVDVTDGQGNLYHGLILFTDNNVPKAKGRIVSTHASEKPKFQIRLFQGVPKGGKFDFIIEKATELGVHSIHPFVSEKNPIKIKEDPSPTKEKRWQNIAIAATKQCGRSTIPDIDSILSFKEMVKELKGDRTFVLDPRASKDSLKEGLKTKIPGAVINLVIGPESGFSDQEIVDLSGAGAQTISLGERVLRTETAGLVALSILNYELDLF